MHGGDKVQGETQGAALARGLDYWQQIKSRLAAKIPPQAYNNWVVRTKLEAQENGSLRVQVPDRVTKDFLEQEYGEDIRRAIHELNLPVRGVVYTEALCASPGESEPPAQTMLEPVFASTA